MGCFVIFCLFFLSFFFVTHHHLIPSYHFVLLSRPPAPLTVPFIRSGTPQQQQQPAAHTPQRHAPAAMALALQLFTSHSDDIIVPHTWRPVPGDAIPGTPGHFIGRPFGAGCLSMNQIFDVLDNEGRSVGQALKVCVCVCAPACCPCVACSAVWCGVPLPLPH